MAFKLATAFVNIRANLKPLGAGLDLAKQMVAKSMAIIARIGAATAAIFTAATAGAIKIAADGQEMRSMFKAVFQEGSADAEAFATTLAQKLGRSVGDIMGSMAGFQDLFVPLGFARNEAKELSKQMVSLVQDISSFKNVDPEEAARDFNSALIGNHETVRKYGVIIDEATLKAELAKKGQDKLTGAALNQAKVMARLSLIVAGTTDAQGDAERTAGSFTNRVRGLFGAIKDLGELYGGMFLPLGTKVLEMMTKLVRDVSTGAKDMARNVTLWTQVMADNWELTIAIMQRSFALSWDVISNFPLAAVFGRLVGRQAKSIMDLFSKLGSLGKAAFWDKLTGGDSASKMFKDFTDSAMGAMQGESLMDFAMRNMTDAQKAELDAIQGMIKEVGQLKADAEEKQKEDAIKAAEEAEVARLKAIAETEKKAADLRSGPSGAQSAVDEHLKKASGGFTDTKSITLGIQEALLKQNDPQVQMVTLLGDANTLAKANMKHLQKIAEELTPTPGQTNRDPPLVEA